VNPAEAGLGNLRHENGVAGTEYEQTFYNSLTNRDGDYCRMNFVGMNQL
jgi:hypothetical protein